MAEPNRETVIVDRGGSGAGMLVGIVLVVAVLAIGYLVFFNGDGAGGAERLHPVGEAAAGRGLRLDQRRGPVLALLGLGTATGGQGERKDREEEKSSDHGMIGQCANFRLCRYGLCIKTSHPSTSGGLGAVASGSPPSG